MTNKKTLIGRLNLINKVQISSVIFHSFSVSLFSLLVDISTSLKIVPSSWLAISNIRRISASVDFGQEIPFYLPTFLVCLNYLLPRYVLYVVSNVVCNISR